MRLCITKWLFVAKLRSIRSLATIEEKAVAASEAERQMHERDFNLMVARNPNINLKEELQEARNEINDLCEQISGLQYS